jgi:hypothetical protein
MKSIIQKLEREGYPPEDAEAIAKRVRSNPNRRKRPLYNLVVFTKRNKLHFMSGFSSLNEAERKARAYYAAGFKARITEMR